MQFFLYKKQCLLACLLVKKTMFLLLCLRISIGKEWWHQNAYWGFHHGLGQLDHKSWHVGFSSSSEIFKHVIFLLHHRYSSILLSLQAELICTNLTSSLNLNVPKNSDGNDFKNIHPIFCILWLSMNFNVQFKVCTSSSIHLTCVHIFTSLSQKMLLRHYQ